MARKRASGAVKDKAVAGATGDDKDSKFDEPGFLGSMPVNLDRTMDGGEVLRDKLAGDLSRWLTEELDAQQDRVDKLSEWDRMYVGHRPAKSFPFEKSANFAPPIIPSLVDNVAVRNIDAIWGQKKVFLCKSQKEPFKTLSADLEDGLDWWQKDIVHLKAKLYPVILQSVKTGTGIVKVDWTRKKRTGYRYTDDTEAAVRPEGTIKLANGQKGRKDKITVYDGPDVIPISREDWVISADARTIQDAFMCGFRTYLRKPEIESRVRVGLYDKGVADKLGPGDSTDTTKQDKAENAFRRMISDKEGKYEVWEVWLRYDVDEDGEEDDIVVTFHRESRTVLRAIYNPFFIGFRPFVAFVYNPSEFQFDGRGLVEALEKSQLEVDAIHNQRRDRGTLLNSPIFVVQEGTQLENFKFAPGMVYMTNGNPQEVINKLDFGSIYPDSFAEEDRVISYMQQVAGVGPQNLGQSVSERPVAKETLAIIQETNKKRKNEIDNFRDSIAEIGRLALEMWAQYQPQYTFYKRGELGLESKTIDFPLEYLWDGIKVDLVASSEMLNTEARREIGLAMYQLYSSYMTNLAGMAQAMVDPMVPPQFKEFLIRAGQVSDKIMAQIVRDFGEWEPEELRVPLPAPVMAPPPPPVGSGAPQPGAPGPQGPQGQGMGPQGPVAGPPQQPMPPMPPQMGMGPQ